jgi:tetratricopeptide (TPR) repeat protein
MNAGRAARVLWVTTALAVGLPRVAAPQPSPLFDNMALGPHAVGFTVVSLSDPSRPSKPERDAAGQPAADRSRTFRALVWYPARAQSGGQPMRVADALTAHLPAGADEEVRQRQQSLRQFLSQFGEVPDARWQALLDTPMLASRGAPPAGGRFPLVVGQLRPFSTTLTVEYLASHGYVVAMTHGEEVAGVTDPGAGLEIALRDMEFAIAELRRRPDVDPAALAALGFSGAGFSQILLAMRHPDVDAVCDLESAIFDDRMMWPLARGWGYDPAAMRVPFLHVYGVPLSKLETRIADFEAMRYSTRYRYLVDAPALHHWDFATEGRATTTVLGLRGEATPHLRQAFEFTNRYLLAFLNAHVKKDAAERRFIQAAPAAHGVPAGLVRVRETPGVEPAPTLQAFEAAMIAQGVDAAMRAFHEARSRDPQAPLFREADLNRLGYRLLRGHKAAEAIAVLEAVVALYPRSANAYDSLGEALEAAGRRAEALAVTRQGLDALPAQDLPAETRASLKSGMEARLKRLSDASR